MTTTPTQTLALLVAALPIAAAHAQQSADPEALFKSRCAACHGLGRVLAKIEKVPAEQRSAHLARFLVSHGGLDPAQREAMASYLAKAGSEAGAKTK